MEQIVTRTQEAKIHLLRWLKELTREELRFRVVSETKEETQHSQTIVFWGPKFTGDLLKIKITDDQGTLNCEVLNAKGLSLLPHTNRTKEFFRQMGMLIGGKENVHAR